YSLQYMQRVLEGLRDRERVPTILFTRNSGVFLEEMAASGCSALSVDWTVDMADAKRRVGEKVVLQGNLNPEFLKRDPEIITQAATAILKVFAGQPGHVFNLGHGITPDINPDQITHRIASIHAYHA